MSRFVSRPVAACCLTALVAGPAVSQDVVRLAERFSPAEPYRVELRVSVTGRVTLPAEDGKTPQTLPVAGTSLLVYDERVLPPDESKADRLVRIYRDVTFRRTVGDREQEADVRRAVRRMVVLRSDRGKKAPFSPDGPLTWGEIDVVRTDLYVPALVPGLLPANPVRPGDKWPASPAAVTDLTDLDPVEDGGLTVTLVSVVAVDGKRFARLGVSGTVKGVTEDGPARQSLDGTAYFDLTANALTYLTLAGSRELFGPDGKTVVGRTDGKVTLARKPAGAVAELSAAALHDADQTPTPENTQLLYDNADLGVRFLHPRRWRVGAVQGRQVTLEEAKGGGVLVTLEPAESLPTAAQFLTETRAFLAAQKWELGAADAPARWATRPAVVDRFAFDAEAGRERVRMEYAVVSQPDGGATVAARLPWAERDELRADLDRVLKSLTITKRIGK